MRLPSFASTVLLLTPTYCHSLTSFLKITSFKAFGNLKARRSNFSLLLWGHVHFYFVCVRVKIGIIHSYCLLNTNLKLI